MRARLTPNRAVKVLNAMVLNLAFVASASVALYLVFFGVGP